MAVVGGALSQQQAAVLFDNRGDDTYGGPLAYHQA